MLLRPLQKLTNRLGIFALLVALSCTTCFCKPPRITIIFVIDQCAYHYIQKTEPFFQGGLKMLLTEGVVYKNAYMPHGNPTTGPGHTAISTGAYAKDHGITDNILFDQFGKKHGFDFSDRPDHAVFSKDGLSAYGISADKIMVDNLSDQFVRSATPQSKKIAFALSNKSRAAVAMAGKLGKAIWFDDESQEFTTSKAYFDKKPVWLAQFNAQHPFAAETKKFPWKLLYSPTTAAYDFFNTNNYMFASHPFSYLNTPLATIQKLGHLTTAEAFLKTPFASQYLLDLAQICFEQNLSKNANDKLLLWISLSSLDMIGHFYGPDSQETLDYLYHLDMQLKTFIDQITCKVDAHEILFGLTADHGVEPIIELLQQQGFSNIHRINTDSLITRMNALIFKTYGITNLVKDFSNPQFYLDQKIFSELTQYKQKMILKTLTNFLEQQPGITKAWSLDELQNECFDVDDSDNWYKLQLYPGRSGALICKCNPYSAITNYATGTQHQSTYEYDTHVPLVLYQKGSLQKKVILEKVLLTQLAATLAKKLEIARPSASVTTPLPGA